jgi:hypothetical protein
MAWTAEIPDDQWAVYQRVIRAAQEQGLRFALGGAFAMATYSGRWRNTKDLDLFIVPESRDEVVALLTRSGLCDYYEQLAYDREWIYRGCDGEIIVDVIWAMANKRADVAPAWLTHGPEVEVRGERVRILPPEAVIWNKLYIIHKDRCDWPDVVNIIYGVGPSLDWQELITQLADDVPLLRGALSLFAWLSPGRAAQLPAWLWEQLQLPRPAGGEQVDRHHVELIDSRPWYGPALPEGTQPAI